MKFESHGKFTIWTEKSTVFAELLGSWNEESALQFELEFKKIASTMPDQWGHLVYLDDWELCVPEMFEIIERLVIWCINNGLMRAANIYQESSIKSGVLNKMIIQKQGNFERVVFDNDLDASRWLTEAGFPTSCPPRKK
tara:strand:- start:696 stop:1112 length:417 start_codon:yes stop_codon:yes gene_type:complete